LYFGALKQTEQNARRICLVGAAGAARSTRTSDQSCNCRQSTRNPGSNTASAAHCARNRRNCARDRRHRARPASAAGKSAARKQPAGREVKPPSWDRVLRRGLIFAPIMLVVRVQEVLVVKARLDALANQINPHFLFNTLNSISSLIRTNPTKARAIVIKLSHILRKLLQGHENFISLREELEFIDNYLDIEVIRFGKDKLKIEKEIDADSLKYMIPSMILQPIIENSIKHGIAPKIEGGSIKIRSTKNKDKICIEVEDNGVGISDEMVPRIYSSGIGISNIIERLKVAYQSDYVFTVNSFPGQGTFTHIEIPVLEGSTREKAG
jgi:two-component sensor histidine kinase